MRTLLLASLVAVTTLPAKAEFTGFGPKSVTTDTAPYYNSTPLGRVFADYARADYRWSRFTNRYGNQWHVWTSHTSGNTLIWSVDNNGGRGEAFNCKASDEDNFWGQCTRYDVAGGFVNGFVSVTIGNGGEVIDR